VLELLVAEVNLVEVLVVVVATAVEKLDPPLDPPLTPVDATVVVVMVPSPLFVVTGTAPAYRVLDTVVSKVLEPEVIVSTTTVVAVGVAAVAPVPLLG